MRGIVIGICDDVLAAITQINSIIEPYLAKTNKHVRILQFQSGEAVLKEIKNIDILFLDIEMPGLDGIKTGELIRKKNSDCKIIMATSKLERFKEAFKISAFRFVSKPFEEEELIEALSDAIDTMIGWETIDLYENRILYQVPQRDIHIIKAYGSSVEIRVGNRYMRKEVTMTSLWNELDKRLFFQVDRRYVINMLHINHYQNGIIEIGHDEFTISRRRKKEFERIYQEFDVTYGDNK